MDKKFFEFSSGDIKVVIAANNAKEAIDYYITQYIDDIYLDDMVFEGLQIRELFDDEIKKVRPIYNEHIKNVEYLSYKALLAKHYKDDPMIIVTMGYYS
jgi:hypothetical protein